MRDAATAIAIPRRKKRFVRDGAEGFQLTQRDIALVRHVAEHRFLNSMHLSRLCRAPHAKVCRRLQHLFHAGYLDRPRAQFEAYREGGGSAPIVYALGNRGARLLNDSGIDLDWSRKNALAGRLFIEHTLAVADVRVALQSAIRSRPGFELLDGDELLALAPEKTRHRPRPWQLRTLVHHRGVPHHISVEPDYIFAIRSPDGRMRMFVVECDRGTMPIERADLLQTSLKRKMLAYAAAKRAGLHWQQLGWKSFRVLVITTNAQRVENVLAMIRKFVPAHEHALFLITDRESLAAHDFLSHSWRDADDQTRPLYDNTSTSHRHLYADCTAPSLRAARIKRELQRTPRSHA